MRLNINILSLNTSPVILALSEVKQIMRCGEQISIARNYSTSRYYKQKSQKDKLMGRSSHVFWKSKRRLRILLSATRQLTKLYSLRQEQMNSMNF